jgi:DNA-binding MarR family transcriptional regulator
MAEGERLSGTGGRRGEALSGLGLDKIIHERARLMILTYLASSQRPEAGFTEIRDALGFTAGNLSVQLKTLEEAGYVEIAKKFVDNKSYTGARLTTAGQRALDAYLAELEVIVASLKGGNPREDALAALSPRDAAPVSD